jgi:hypothetical protein
MHTTRFDKLWNIGVGLECHKKTNTRLCPIMLTNGSYPAGPMHPEKKERSTSTKSTKAIDKDPSHKTTKRANA